MESLIGRLLIGNVLGEDFSSGIEADLDAIRFCNQDERGLDLELFSVLLERRAYLEEIQVQVFARDELIREVRVA